MNRLRKKLTKIKFINIINNVYIEHAEAQEQYAEYVARFELAKGKSDTCTEPPAAPPMSDKRDLIIFDGPPPKQQTTAPPKQQTTSPPLNDNHCDVKPKKIDTMTPEKQKAAKTIYKRLMLEIHPDKEIARKQQNPEAEIFSDLSSDVTDAYNNGELHKLMVIADFAGLEFKPDFFKKYKHLIDEELQNLSQTVSTMKRHHIWIWNTTDNEELKKKIEEAYF